MISFKGTHFPKDVILYAVFFYVRYGVSYRDLEEIMEERGVNVDHATIRQAIIVNCLLEKGSGSVFITALRQHEIKRITLTINSSV
jgi:putative transposase